jgi:hypothetical protein
VLPQLLACARSALAASNEASVWIARSSI